MAAELLLKDGIRYLLYTPKSEDEFERSIKHHARDIFGEDSLYFDIKKKISSITGESSIPDGYLVNLSQKQLYLIEIELSSHQEYDHITKQLSKFLKALNNYQTSQKIARLLKEEIEADPDKTKLVRDRIGTKELYQFLLEDVLEEVAKQNYQVIVAIDQKTPRLEETFRVLSPRPRILEFKTYSQENVEGAKVHIHQFEPLVGAPLPAPPEGVEKLITQSVAPQEIKEIFEELQSFIMKLGDIQKISGMKHPVLGFKKRGGRRFIRIDLNPRAVNVLFFGRIPLDIKEKLIGKAKGYRYFPLKSKEQIPYVKGLIKQAYEFS